MISDLTNVYEIMKREFPVMLSHFGDISDKEVASYFYYNAHNQLQYRTVASSKHMVYFRKFRDGYESAMFMEENNICFFPLNRLFDGSEITAFKIGTKAKSVKLNQNGLFIEKSDLSQNISIDYYDFYAISKMLGKGLNVNNIDTIEKSICRQGIRSDSVIDVKKENGYILLTITENGEVIKSEKIPFEDGRTFYSVYYEYMKEKDYYMEPNPPVLSIKIIGKNY